MFRHKTLEIFKAQEHQTCGKPPQVSLANGEITMKYILIDSDILKSRMQPLMK